MGEPFVIFLAFAAALVCLVLCPVVFWFLGRIFDRLEREMPRQGVPERPYPVSPAVHRLQQDVEDVRQTLNRVQQTAPPAQPPADLNAALRDALLPLQQRLDRLEIRAAQPAPPQPQPLSQPQAADPSETLAAAIRQELSFLRDHLQPPSTPSADPAVSAIESRLTLLEQSLQSAPTDEASEEWVSRMERLEELAAASRQQAALFESAISRNAAALEDLLQRMEQLAEDVRAAAQNFPPPQEEPAQDGVRIESSTSAAQEKSSGEKKPSPSTSRGRKGPRMISAAGRERYQEVVRLWEEGSDPESIAMMTGLEAAEIELMIAGLSPQVRS